MSRYRRLASTPAASSTGECEPPPPPPPAAASLALLASRLDAATTSAAPPSPFNGASSMLSTSCDNAVLDRGATAPDPSPSVPAAGWRAARRSLSKLDPVETTPPPRRSLRDVRGAVTSASSASSAAERRARRVVVVAAAAAAAAAPPFSTSFQLPRSSGYPDAAAVRLARSGRVYDARTAAARSLRRASRSGDSTASATSRGSVGRFRRSDCSPSDAATPAFPKPRKPRDPGDAFSSSYSSSSSESFSPPFPRAFCSNRRARRSSSFPGVGACVGEAIGQSNVLPVKRTLKGKRG